MKHAMILTTLLLSACAAGGVDPAFKDVQRRPPAVTDAAASYLVQNERPLAEWIAETRKKCAHFGCAE